MTWAANRTVWQLPGIEYTRRKRHAEPVQKKKKSHWCFVCGGKGEKKDAKSGKLRPCAACKGTGKIEIS